MRLACALALSLAISGFSLALDDPKPSIAEKFKTAKKENQEGYAALMKEYQAATDAKAKNDLVPRLMEYQPKYAEKYLAIGSEDPKNPESCDPLLAALMTGRGNPASVKAADLLIEHHLNNTAIKGSIQNLAGAGKPGQKVLKALSEKATDKNIKGLALYFVGSGMLEEADYPRTGTPMAAAEQAAAFKEAETMLKKAAAEYGDVQIASPRGDSKTIAKAAEGDLFFLNNLTVGKMMPDAEVEDLDGKKVKISDMRGKVVVLDIWATWCGPCRAMIPHERELVTRMKDKPFVFISLSADAKKDTLTQFIEKEPMPWTHWWNGGAQGAALEKYRIKFFPTVYVIDEKGVIRSKHVRGEAMDKAVDGLIKDMKTKG
jgi:thiol-disulfide isomerase/thioredoxin